VRLIPAIGVECDVFSALYNTCTDESKRRNIFKKEAEGRKGDEIESKKWH
jgi:hypothetical protein